MTIVTVGIDLAKNVFAVHGVDEAGKPALVRPEVSRGKLLELIASQSVALPHQHASLLRCPLLGTRICQVGPHGAPGNTQTLGRPARWVQHRRGRHAQ
jgi:hypothetical protein